MLPGKKKEKTDRKKERREEGRKERKKGRMTEKRNQEKKEKENYNFYILETFAHRFRRLYWDKVACCRHVGEAASA